MCAFISRQSNRTYKKKKIMREIKFRALKDDMSNCKFYYGSLIYDELWSPRIYDVDIGLFTTCLKGTEGQFTGLLDKNGVEIYDGDIVFDQVKGFDKRKSVIQLDSVNPCFVLKRIDNKYSFTDYEYDFSHCGLMTIEVIGNIHENKELI